jgi:hypothetical protein
MYINTKTSERLEAAITIDRDALDDELVMQPQLLWQVSEAYTDAVSRADQAKEALAVSQSKVSLRIRRDLSRKGEKATENIITAKINTDEEYQAAIEEHLTAKNEAEKLRGLKEAYLQRGFVLKDLCALYVAGYFGETTVRGANVETVRRDEYARNRVQLAKNRRAKRGRL